MRTMTARLIAAATVVLVVGLGACSSDGPAATPGPADTPAPVVTPAPIDPAPQPTPDTSTNDDGPNWMLIALIGGGILVAIVLVGAVISRKQKPTGTAASPQSNLLSTAQWIHDQLTLELMAAPPTSALQRWTLERRRLDDVAIGAQQQFAEGNDANWQPMAQTMSTLASAIDTNLALRAQEPPNPQLVAESTDVVTRNRAALAQLITALRPTIDR